MVYGVLLQRRIASRCGIARRLESLYDTGEKQRHKEHGTNLRSLRAGNLGINGCIDSFALLAINLLQRNGKQHVLIRLNLHDLRLRQDMVTRAQLPANLRLPILHIPLQPLRRNPTRLLQRDDADVLSKDILLAILAHLDTMLAGLEEEGQARARQQIQPSVGVGGRLLELVQVVQLGNTLVDTAAEAA